LFPDIFSFLIFTDEFFEVCIGLLDFQAIVSR